MFVNIIKVLLGNASASIVTYISLLYLSLVLPSSIYGNFTQFYYALAIVLIIIDLGLSSSLVISLSNKLKIFSIINVINIYKFHYILLFTILYMTMNYLFGYTTSLLICSISMLSLINKFISIKLQVIEKWSESARVIFFMTFIRSIFLIVFVYAFNKYSSEHIKIGYLELNILFAALISLFITHIYTCQKFKEIEKEKINKKDLNHTSIYLYFGSILAIICMRADVFLIDHFINSNSAGEYAKVSIIFFVFPMLISSINSVLLRYYSVDDNSSHNILANHLKKITIICMLIYITVLIFIFIFKEYIHTFFKYEMIAVFMVLLLAYIGALISGTYESKIMARNQKYYMLIKLVQLITIMIIFLISYKHLGVLSAAIAFLMSRISGWLMIINYHVSGK
ncbi:hypothetical protein [Providencia huaxiensis]|uniref:hypothetical protein n=1 Tax=Providencia huaxiensis TaxID=2027290 RepID=UPI0034E4C79B